MILVCFSHAENPHDRGKHGLNDCCLWFCAQSALRQLVDQPIRDVLLLLQAILLKQAIKTVKTYNFSSSILKSYKFAAESRMLQIKIFNASGFEVKFSIF